MIRHSQSTDTIQSPKFSQSIVSRLPGFVKAILINRHSSEHKFNSQDSHINCISVAWLCKSIQFSKFPQSIVSRLLGCVKAILINRHNSEHKIQFSKFSKSTNSMFLGLLGFVKHSQSTDTKLQINKFNVSNSMFLGLLGFVKHSQSTDTKFNKISNQQIQCFSVSWAL